MGLDLDFLLSQPFKILFVLYINAIHAFLAVVLPLKLVNDSFAEEIALDTRLKPLSLVNSNLVIKIVGSKIE